MITHLTALSKFIFSSTLWARKILPVICWKENGTWRHTRSSWQSKELNHPSPSLRIHKPPLNLKSKGSGFCVRYGQEKFFLFRSSSIFILFIYLFLHSAGPGCTLWTRQQNWREYFSSTLSCAFLMDCTWSFVNEQGLQNGFCLGQWNSWGQPCHLVSLTLSLPYLYLGFSPFLSLFVVLVTWADSWYSASIHFNDMFL